LSLTLPAFLPPFAIETPLFYQDISCTVYKKTANRPKDPLCKVILRE
jgi:hypothetical protein